MVAERTPKSEMVHKREEERKRTVVPASNIQFKVKMINKEYAKIKADTKKAKVNFLDRIKDQILASKKKS